MRILINNINQYQNNNGYKRSFVKPLEFDTVSFGALKKSKFQGLELAVIEKFKSPIEKFNSHDDFDKWANDKVCQKLDNNYGGRVPDVILQRVAILNEWKDFLDKKELSYTPAMKLLIADAVVKDLKPENDKMPPPLNADVLAETMNQLDKKLAQDYKQGFDLSEIYNDNLMKVYMTEDYPNIGLKKWIGKIFGMKSTAKNIEADSDSSSMWIRIPSKKHDPENFNFNVEKLKVLSHRAWCTKSYRAKSYLEDGDFHVYLEDGKPKIGLHFIGNSIQEIQGEKNNGYIPLKYYDVVLTHIKNNNLKRNLFVKQQIEDLETRKKTVEVLKQRMGDAIETNDVKKIFRVLGISSSEDENGLLSISHYSQPQNRISFTDLGINENNLFKKVSKIRTIADFKGSELTDLGELTEIGSDVFFSLANIRSLGKLKRIGGSANFENSYVQSLGELEEIKQNANFGNSKILSLEKLKTIGGNASFKYSFVQDLGKLETIGGDADFTFSRLTSLNSLKEIKGNADFRKSLIEDLGQLESVHLSAFFEHSSVSSLKNLKEVGLDLDIRHSSVNDLGKLEFVGRDLILDSVGSNYINVRNLKTVQDTIYCGRAQKEYFKDVNKSDIRVGYSFRKMHDICF